MDELLTRIPPKYLGLAAAVLLLLRALDALIRLIPDRYLAAHTTEQAVVNAVRKVLGYVVTWKLPPGKSAAVLLALLLASPALADEPPVVVLPHQRIPPAQLETTPVVLPTPAVEMPPATPAVPIVPTFSDVAACTIASLPGTIGRCVADPGKVAPLDSRAFWTALISGIGTSVVVPVATFLITHYLPPEPLK